MSRVKLWFFCLCLLANTPSAVSGQILDQSGNILAPILQNHPLEQLFIQDIGDVIKTLHSPTVLRGLTFKEDKLWGVTSSGFGGTGPGVLYEIDADTGTVRSTLNISPSLPATFGLGYDLKRDLFIVTDCKVDMIFKVDPTNGNVIDSFPSPGSVPVGAAYDSIRDGYWISDSKNTVDLVSPETGAIISSLPAPSGASRIAGTGYDPFNDVLMFHSRDSAETYLIRASDGTQLAVFPTPPSPGTNNGQGAAIRLTDLTGYLTNFEFDDTIFVIDLGIYRFSDLSYTPVTPCRIADTRKAGGAIGANTQRDFHVHGNGSTISAQGGNPAGCSAPMRKPLAAHINMVAVNPTGKGNMQVFPVGGAPGANLGVNFANIGTNFANAGTVESSTGSGPDITVASNFSSAHTVIDILGYYYPDGDLMYTPVTPCRIADTRKSGGKICANTERGFNVHGSGSTIRLQGGSSAGCPAPLGEPLAALINLVAVNPTGKGNMQAFAVGGNPGANLGVNFSVSSATSEQCDNPAGCPPPPWTNFANAGIVETGTGSGADIMVTSQYSSAHAVISVLGYYYPDGDLTYTPVKPCRIADTRNTPAGIIEANTQRYFHVFGDSGTIGDQGGNPSGCPASMGEPLAVHINMVAVNPTGKGNMQVFPVGGAPGANLGVNFANIGTNFANAVTVETTTGTGPDIAVTARWSSAHTVIDVLGYYYPDLEYGLEAYYPFNGDADDESGNGYDGIIHGDTSLCQNRFGSSDSAYCFDGNGD